LLLAVSLPLGLRAQLPGGRIKGGYSIPFNDDAGRPVSLLTGSQATMRTGGLLELTDVEVQNFDADGRTNLLVSVEKCLFDHNTRVARSAEPLRVRSGDGRLDLQGRGFTWWQTNSLILISNDVRTTVRRVSGSTNPPLVVESARLQAHLHSNVVEFLDAVRVRDPQMDLDCERLVVRRGADGELDDIRALGGVHIRNHRDQSTIEAEEAWYRTTAEGEWVELSGQPRWTDGTRSAEARWFLLDRTRNRFQAVGEARIRLPRSARGLSALGAVGPSSIEPEAEVAEPVELLAGLITLQLPPTNGPVQGVTARTNVVIRLPDEGLEGHAAEAEYRPDGVVRLRGEPSWTWGDRRGSGDLIEFSTNETFRIEGNAFLRFPVESLGNVLPGGTQVAGGEPFPQTNTFVEVRSDHVDYRDQLIRFGDSVRARCVRGEELLGTLDSRELLVAYSNRVDGVTARGNVQVQQVPTAEPDGRVIGRTLAAEEVTARLSALGRLREVAAHGHVVGVQTTRRSGDGEPQVGRLLCATLRAWLAPDTNRVDRLEATGGVRAILDARMAWGSRADYVASDGLLRLSGSPLVLLPEGRVLGADELTLNPETGRVGGRGQFRTYWTQLPFDTNSLATLPGALEDSKP
jgi:lipopolysaccharide export system protein LptA